jgi:hypothetical protein
MDATVDAAQARDALKTLRGFVGKPLRGVKVAALAEVTTNAEGGSVTIRRWSGMDATAGMDASTSAIEGGTVHVEADALATAIGKAKGTARLTTDGDRLTVTTDAGTSAVRIDTSGDVLPVPYADAFRDFVTILPSERDRVRSVAGAAASERDARAVLASVAIRANGDGSGEAVATDTYRMHGTRLTRVSGDADTVRIFPAYVIATAAKTSTSYLRIEVSEDGKHYRANFLTVKGTKKSPRTTFFTVSGMAIEGPYPNYRTLIPDADSANACWSVRDAAGTASVLAGFANRENAAAVFTPSGSAVAISATYRDGTTREGIAPLRPDGDAIGLDAFVAFNPSYFSDGVKHAGDGAVVRLRDSLKAALIEGEHGYALVMPMRVN